MINSPFPKVVFGDYVEFQPKITLRKGEAYPFVPMENVTPGVRNVYSVENKVWNGSGSKFEPDDILFARITPCLENKKIAVAKVNGKGFGSTEYFVLRGYKGKLDQTFLYYLAITDLLVVSAINSYVGASGRQRADAKFLRNIEINLPPINVQRKIAAILSGFDELIQNNKRRITLLEKMAEEIYREWFVRFRFPGYKTAEFEKGVPKGWGYEKLDDLCSVIKRGISPKYDEESSGTVINQKCIRNGRINLAEARAHDTKTPTEKYIRYSEALINSTGVGTLGRVSVVEFEPDKITVDSHVTICRADTKKVMPEYLAVTVSQLQHYFEFMASGSTGQVELNRSLIAGIKIRVPDEGLQGKFIESISGIWKQKQKLFQANDNLVKTKDMLLPRLISGKLQVSDLDIQFPASMSDEDAA